MYTFKLTTVKFGSFLCLFLFSAYFCGQTPQTCDASQIMGNPRRTRIHRSLDFKSTRSKKRTVLDIVVDKMFNKSDSFFLESSRNSSHFLQSFTEVCDFVAQYPQSTLVGRFPVSSLNTSCDFLVKWLRKIHELNQNRNNFLTQQDSCVWFLCCANVPEQLRTGCLVKRPTSNHLRDDTWKNSITHRSEPGNSDKTRFRSPIKPSTASSTPNSTSY